MNASTASVFEGVLTGPTVPRGLWLTRSIGALAAAAGALPISVSVAAAPPPAAAAASDTASMVLFDAAEAAD